ncbi:MAG: Bax inhibitor-1/YccA family protein [Deferribacterales bacterium]|nr:Bax inhibitor-1/YccA family protein [Deferribacterales bacterium]
MNYYQTERRRVGELTDSIYIRQVYVWMTIGLALTGLVAMYAADSQTIRQAVFGSTFTFIILIIAQFGMVIALSAAVHKMSAGMATGIFLLYSAISGVTFSSIFLVYTAESISTAFFTAAGMFLLMSVYGTVTKRDLTNWGSFLFMGLIGIVIASIVNIFLKNSTMSLVISCIGVIVFTGLTAYDTQKLRRLGAEIDVNDSLTMRRMVILGALTLYLDFINLFLMLLQLFGGRRD